MSTLLFGLELHGVKGRLWTDYSDPKKPDSSEAAWDERFSDPDPNGSASIGFQKVDQLPCRVYFTKAGYKPMTWPPEGEPPSLPVDGAIELRMEKNSLPAGASAHQAGTLTMSGPIFRVNGSAWRWLGCTAFALPMLHAAGENIEAFLDWAIATGFTTLRGFFAFHYIPSQMGRPDFVATSAQTRAFLEALARREVRCEWTCGDMQIVKPDLQAQKEWYAAQADVIKDFPLATAETCNEPFKNGVDVVAIGRFGQGIVQTSGNYGPPCLPRLDYGVTHTPRDDEWPRKAKELYDLYEGWADLPGGIRIPWVSDEGMGADETNQPGKRSNVPNDFFDDAACASLMGAGLTHHGTDVIFARVPGPTQQACAAAAVAGATAFDPEVATGQYTRGGLSDCPLEHDDATALRTFVRMRGNRADALVIRPTTATRVARNGWRITSMSGPDNRIVRLER